MCACVCVCVPSEFRVEICHGFVKRRTKLFARWLHGTCVEAPPEKIETEDELFVVSYFFDISANPDVLSLVSSIQQSIKKSIASVSRYLMRWKRYRSIWKIESEKVSTGFP